MHDSPTTNISKTGLAKFSTNRIHDHQDNSNYHSSVNMFIASLTLQETLSLSSYEQAAIVMHH